MCLEIADWNKVVNWCVSEEQKMCSGPNEIDFILLFGRKVIQHMYCKIFVGNMHLVKWWFVTSTKRL